MVGFTRWTSTARWKGMGIYHLSFPNEHYGRFFKRKKLCKERYREQEQEGNQGRGGWTMWANGWDYQRRGCCEKPRIGQDGEESSTMRPTLVSRTVEEREREAYAYSKPTLVPYSTACSVQNPFPHAQLPCWGGSILPEVFLHLGLL